MSHVRNSDHGPSVPRSSGDEVAERVITAGAFAGAAGRRQREQALRRILAARLSVPSRRIGIVSGEASRIKRVSVEGLSLEAIESLLSP